MNIQYISLECLYEIKCTRRNVLFNIFVLLVFLVIIFSPFIFYPLGDKIGNIALPWYLQALPSSIPYMTAYYYNFIQLLFVIFMTSNDLRRDKLTAMSALDAHPQSNTDITIGRFAGRIILFSGVSVIVFFIATGLNAIYFPRAFNGIFYLFYWITLTMPALIYFMGLSIFVTRLANNQGTSIFIVLLLGVGATFYGTGIMYNLLDPLARDIPNLFSDFTGHACLYPYLLHRMIYTFMGIFLLIFSIRTYRRVPNNPHSTCKNLIIGVYLVIIIVLSTLYYSYFNGIERSKNDYRQIYLKHEETPTIQILKHDITLQETSEDHIFVESKMVITNRDQESIPILLYLNPGLQVINIKMNDEEISFEREGQVLVVNKSISKRDTCHLVMTYGGYIDNSVCYPEITLPESGQTRDILHFGDIPAFCSDNYKLFTPECLWYPVGTPPTCFSISRKTDFTKYTLKVIHDKQHVAISQGRIFIHKPGETLFQHDHALQGISLCIGKYSKKSILVDSIQVEIYCLPGHEYLLPDFQVDTNVLKEVLSDIKFQQLEDRLLIYRQRSKSGPEELDKQIFGTPNLRYPFHWLRLVETPASFNCHAKNDEIDGERVQAGFVFLPEKLCTKNELPIKTWDFQVNDSDIPPDHKSNIIHAYLENFVDSNLNRGDCNIKLDIRKPCNHVYSADFPLIDDVLSVMMNQDFRFNTDGNMIDYKVNKYMSCHSLLEAINDSYLLPGELFSILEKKSQELRAIIYTLVPKSDFENLYFEFFSTYRFTNVDFQVFADEFHHRFDIDLNEILRKWYRRERLPVFHTKGNCYTETLPPNVSKDSLNLYYVHEIFNASDEDGVVILSPGGYFSIPKHACKKIVIKARANSASHSSSWIKGNLELLTSFNIEMPMSQNLPSTQTYWHREGESLVTNMQTGIFDSDSLSFQENTEKIIIDNLDSGCNIIESKSWLQTLLGKYKMDLFPLMRKRKDKNEWYLDINEKYYGFPIKSAYCKLSEQGSFPIEWNHEVPQSGEYEIFVHSINHSRNPSHEYEKNQYFSICVGSDTQDIEINVDEQNEGWISLGKYRINDKIKVIQYDKQDFLANWLFKSNNVVVADAIKLRRIP